MSHLHRIARYKSAKQAANTTHIQHIYSSVACCSAQRLITSTPS